MDAASFKTSIDSMSFGLIPENARSTPSTKIRGSLLLLIEEPPRMRIVASAPGVLLLEYRRAPAIFPFKPSPIVFTGTFFNASPLTFVIAEVIVLLDCVP